MSVLTFVPLRSPGLGKTRLAPDLAPEERAGLAGAMLADVVRAVRMAEIGPIVIVAAGPGAVAAGAALNVSVVVDPPETSSLDDALEHARRQCASDRNVLVVQADLPYLAPADVICMVESSADVVLAPNDDGGTSALLRRPGDVMGTAFGPDSAAAHRKLAAAAGASIDEVHRPGLRHDVDTAQDVAGLTDGNVGPVTARFLVQHPELLSE